MTPTPQPWSAKGIYTDWRDGNKRVEYDHVTVEQDAELIASCNACGRSAYESVRSRVGPEGFQSTNTTPTPNGLTLVKIEVNPNGYQANVVRLCLECVTDLEGKLRIARQLLKRAPRYVVQQFHPESAFVVIDTTKRHSHQPFIVADFKLREDAQAYADERNALTEAL